MAKFEIFTGTVRDVVIHEGEVKVHMEGSIDGKEVSWHVVILDAGAMAIEPGRTASLVLETEASTYVPDNLEKFLESLMGVLIQSMKLNKTAAEMALMGTEESQIQTRRSEHLTYITQQLRVLWGYARTYLS